MPYIVITYIYSSLLFISYKKKKNINISFRGHMRVPFSHGRKRGNRPQLPDMMTDISHGHWYPSLPRIVLNIIISSKKPLHTIQGRRARISHENLKEL